MNRIFLSISILFFFNLTTNAQERFLKRAQESILKGDYLKAEEYITSYESKESEQPQSNYLRFQLKLKSKGTSISGLDSAYLLLNKVSQSKSGISTKDFSDFCKDFGFCPDKLLSDSLLIDSLLFDAYTRDKSMGTVSTFITKYPANRFTDSAKKIKSHLAFIEAKGKNTEAAFRDYLLVYAGYPDAEEAKNLMWELGFNSAEKENSIDAYEVFIKKYPSARQVSVAKGKIVEIAWTNSQKENTKKGYELFIEKYPDASQVEKAREFIIEIDWKVTVSKNTIEGYKYFLQTYPNSSKVGLAKESIEKLSWKQALSVNTIKSMTDFISQFPGSKFVSEANSIIETLSSLVFPYIISERKYRLYNTYEKKFVGEDVYDLIEVSNNNTFRVKKYNKYGIIDNKGNQVTKITYDCISGFSNNLAVAVFGGKSGLIHKNGAQILPFDFENIFELNNGYFMVSKNIQEKSRYGLCDSTGKIGVDLTYDYLSTLPNGLFVATKDNLKYLINNAGKILSPGYKELTISGKKSLIAMLQQKYGVIQIDGTSLIPFNYKNITGTDTTGFVAELVDGKSTLIGGDGKELIAPLTAQISSISGDLYLMDKRLNANAPSRLFIYNGKLKKYYNTISYDEVGSVSDGLIWIRQGNKSGYIDVDGNQKIPITINEDAGSYTYAGMGVGEGLGGPMEGDIEGEGEAQGETTCYLSAQSLPEFQYSDNALMTHDFSEGYAAISIGQKFGYINKSGGIAIPFIYESATPFIAGIAHVTLREGDQTISQIINKEGKVLHTGYTVQSLNFTDSIAFLVSPDLSYERDFAILDLKTKNIIKSFSDISSLNKFKKYYSVTYKDLDIIITLDGEVLMSDGIDFTIYEAKKLNNEAYGQFYSQKYDDALNLFKKSNELLPRNRETLLGIMKTYIEQKDFYSANNTFNQIIEISSGDIEAFTLHMNMNINRQYWSDALQDCKKLIEISGSSTDFNVYLYKGFAEEKLSMYNEAINSVNYVLQVNKAESAFAYQIRAYCYLQKGEYLKSIQDYTMAIKQVGSGDKETLGLYHNNRGVAYDKLNRKNEACADFKKAADYGDATGIRNYRSCK